MKYHEDNRPLSVGKDTGLLTINEVICFYWKYEPFRKRFPICIIECLITSFNTFIGPKFMDVKIGNADVNKIKFANVLQYIGSM